MPKNPLRRPKILAQRDFVGLRLSFAVSFETGRNLAALYRRWAARNLNSDVWIRGMALSDHEIELISDPASPKPVDSHRLSLNAKAFAASLLEERFTIVPVTEGHRLIVVRVFMKGGDRWHHVETNSVVDAFKKVVHSVQKVDLVDFWHPTRVGELGGNLCNVSYSGFELTTHSLDVDEVFELCPRLFSCFPVGPVIAHCGHTIVNIVREKVALAEAL